MNFSFVIKIIKKLNQKLICIDYLFDRIDKNCNAISGSVNGFSEIKVWLKACLVI